MNIVEKVPAPRSGRFLKQSVRRLRLTTIMSFTTVPNNRFFSSLPTPRLGLPDVLLGTILAFLPLPSRLALRTASPQARRQIDRVQLTDKRLAVHLHLVLEDSTTTTDHEPGLSDWFKALDACENFLRVLSLHPAPTPPENCQPELWHRLVPVRFVFLRFVIFLKHVPFYLSSTNDEPTSEFWSFLWPLDYEKIPALTSPIEAKRLTKLAVSHKTQLAQFQFFAPFSSLVSVAFETFPPLSFLQLLPSTLKELTWCNDPRHHEKQFISALHLFPQLRAFCFGSDAGLPLSFWILLLDTPVCQRPACLNTLEFLEMSNDCEFEEEQMRAIVEMLPRFKPHVNLGHEDDSWHQAGVREFGCVTKNFASGCSPFVDRDLWRVFAHCRVIKWCDLLLPQEGDAVHFAKIFFEMAKTSSSPEVQARLGQVDGRLEGLRSRAWRISKWEIPGGAMETFLLAFTYLYIGDGCQSVKFLFRSGGFDPTWLVEEWIRVIEAALLLKGLDGQFRRQRRLCVIFEYDSAGVVVSKWI